MIDIKRLIMRGDGALVTSLVQQAALLISGLGSAWLIGDTGRGQLAYGMTIGTTVGIVATGGWSSSVALALAGRWAPPSTVLGVVRSVATRRAAAAGLVAVLALIPFRGELDDVVVPIVCGAMMTAVGQLVLQLLVGVAQGQAQAIRANLLRAVVSVAYAAPIAVLGAYQFVAGGEVSVAAVAWSWAASWAFPLVLGAVFLWRNRGQEQMPSATASVVPRMKSFSRSSFLASVSFYELLRADQFVGVLILSTAELGQYVVAASFTGFLKAFGQALGVSMLTATAHSTVMGGVGRRLLRFILMLWAVAGLIILALVPFFTWVLPPEFHSALPASMVLVAAAALSATRRVFVEYAKGAGRPLGGSAAEVVFVVILIVLAVTGLVESSPLGLALATLAACACALLVAAVPALAVLRSPKSPR